MNPKNTRFAISLLLANWLLHGKKNMTPKNKRFAISLLLATLLHAALLLTVHDLLLTSAQPEQQHQPTPTIVYLVSPPRHPGVVEEKAATLADAKLNTANVVETPAKALPSLPPPTPETVPTSIYESIIAALPMPTPVVHIARKYATKTKAKPVTKKPLLMPTPKPLPNKANMVNKSRSQSSFKMAQQSLKNYVVPPARIRTQTLPTQQTQKASLNLLPSVNDLSRWELLRSNNQAWSNNPTEETVNLNTNKIRYASYFSLLRQRVEQGWVYPSQAKRDKLSGSANLVFTIRQDGHLLNVRISRSSGSVILDESAVRAVQNAAPFAPFPQDWSLERLHIRATFEYISRRLALRD